MRLITATLALIVSMSAAIAASDTTSLGLQEAIDIALRQNPNLLASRSDVDAARANERSAGTLTNPELVVSPTIAGTAGSDSAVLIVQPLEINGSRAIRTRIARAEKDATQAAHLSVERDVVRSVKQAYWEVAQIANVVDLNRQSADVAESIYQAAKRQLDVGSAPGAQAIKAQVESSRARQDLARTESDLLQAKSSLNTLLGRPADTPFDLADELAFSPTEIDENKLRSAAEEARPELAEARSILAARKAEIQAVDARRRPDLTLQARQETFGGDAGLAIGVTLPIIDWGSNRHDRKRAEASADAQSKRVDAVRNGVVLDVDSALREVRVSRKLIEEYEQGVIGQAEQLADMAQKGYKAGATNYLEVLEAQRTLKAVRTEYYAALADYHKSLAQLEWATGVSLSPTQTVGAAAQSRPAKEETK